jgi:hypothetical protein
MSWVFLSWGSLFLLSFSFTFSSLKKKKKKKNIQLFLFLSLFLSLFTTRVVVDGEGKEVIVGTEEQVNKHFADAEEEQKAKQAAAAAAGAATTTKTAPPLPSQLRMWPAPPPLLVVSLPRRVIPEPGNCTATLGICSRMLVRMRIREEEAGRGEEEGAL